jgi:ribosomal protein L37E
MWRVVTPTGHRKPVQVRRAYKFHAYLTRPQEGRAVRLLADHCNLYNAALEERREAWRIRQDTVICPRCGPHDADVNGAKNICTRAGLGSGRARAA